VQFDAQSLGLKTEGLKAHDPLSNEAIPLSRGQASFQMEPFSFRYVWIE
jgi:hypothetical protein